MALDNLTPVLPTLGRTFRPEQWEHSAAKEKIRPFPNYNFFKALELKKKIYQWETYNFVPWYKQNQKRKKTLFSTFFSVQSRPKFCRRFVRSQTLFYLARLSYVAEQSAREPVGNTTLSHTIEGDGSSVYTVNPIVAKMMHCKTAAASKI